MAIKYCDMCGEYLGDMVGDQLFKFGKLVTEEHICSRADRSGWLKAQCPICDREYPYLPEYKPTTCGRFSCLHEAHRRGILPK